jgi:membrane protein implicated in regulation of membrane protease activity
VLFLIAILLAIFVLPSPWGVVAIVVAAVIDLTEVVVGLWWNRRRKIRVGLDTLVGRSGLALGPLRPEGQVKLDGEIWRARCELGCDRGDRVVVRAIDGLTLDVEPT